MRRLCLALLMCALPIGAQSAASAKPDPYQAISFLEGTWEAKTQDAGAGSPLVQGRYTFARELGGHILARHSTNDPGCKGPVSFDCQHSDLLYVYQDAAGQPLKAVYFDNEGHTLHYDVSASSPTAVTFLSQPSPGPRFRLIYELKGGVMLGRFQMQPPGQTEWRSYLEWSGGKIAAVN